MGLTARQANIPRPRQEAGVQCYRCGRSTPSMSRKESPFGGWWHDTDPLTDALVTFCGALCWSEGLPSPVYRAWL